MKDLTFDWDQWNIQKNEIKHGISRLEAESTFFDEEAAIFSDTRDSTAKQKRWLLYGRSIYHNVLMVAFTVRAGKMRIISARKASRKERETYEESKS